MLRCLVPMVLDGRRKRSRLGARVEIVSGMHFEQIAAEYATARPPCPDVVFDTDCALSGWW